MSRRWVLALALGCAGASLGCDLSYLGPGCFGSCADGSATDSTFGDAGADASDASDSDASDAPPDSSGEETIADTSVDSGVESSPDAQTYVDLITEAGTLAWYRFEDSPGATTVLDSSGNSYDGTYDPTGLTFGVPGAVGHAVRFVSSGGGASITDHSGNKLAFSGTTPFSVEAWISLDAVPTKPSTLAQREYFETGGSWNGWTFFVDATNIHFQRLGAVVDDVVGPHSFTPSTWTHLVVTYDGSSMRAYVNGLKLSVAPSSTSLSATAQALGIGTASPVASDEGFPGAIDELAIYTRVLSDAEIENHYLAAK